MKSTTKSAVAFVASHLITKRSANILYDVAEGRTFRYSGTVSDGHIHFKDLTRSNNIMGSVRGAEVRVYDENADVHIDFKIERNSFHGYDPSTGTLFHGGAEGDAVWMDVPQQGRFLYRLAHRQIEPVATESLD